MTLSFRELSTKYLDWSAIHQAPCSKDFYEGHIKSFVAYLGSQADLPCGDLKPFQVEEWVDSHHEEWGPNHSRNAVVAVNRPYNWGIKSGHIQNNPIKTAHKAAYEGRKTYVTPEVFEKIIDYLKPEDPFRDFVNFLWYSGARPQEARAIEPRHVDLANKRILFPAKESKGKRHARRILLSNKTYPIIEILMAKYSEGKLFRNSQGGELTKFRVCARFQEISKAINVHVTAYECRHGFFTRKLKEKVPLIHLAAAGGHVDGGMISKIYSHVHEDEAHLRDVLGD